MISKLKRNFALLALLSCSGGLIGCSSTGNKTTEQTNANSTSTVAANTNQPQTAANDGKTDLTAASGNKVGVPECDEYIEKYEACITKNVPESVRQSLKTSFEQTRKTWKDLAANPQTKSGLASTCKQSQEMAKQSMGAYHCDW